ncbi:flagellar hook-associated protein FlgL [Sphingomonas sp. MMS12-HWE2-04]|uniref:flagellar hook-associated protein FlgL n=1 Tax=Sphingomonas sp. MMS12-HWE2-04 TaxID=3234199 RepID=UPI00384E3589
MRISTSQVFSRPMTLMSQLSNQADSLQTQIATTKRFTAPSASPAAYVQLQGIARANADDDAYAANIQTAQGLLGQADATLESVESQLQRVQELATQAANGTYSDADRTAIAKELDAIRDTMFALANTKDVRGQPIFGGATGDVAYAKAADGSVSFAGTGEPAAIPTGSGSSVQAGISGERVFASGASDIFATLDAFSAALAAGGDVKAAADAALGGVKDTLENVALGRASVGARAARLDLDVELLTKVGDAREAARSGLEDTDIASTVTELQKTLTVLQATQASFTKLSSLSLFDYLN